MTFAVPALVPHSDLDDLRRRLASTRPAPGSAGSDWSRGADSEYLADLVGSWHDDYDWRVYESRIHALPWRCSDTSLGELRFVHQRSEVRDAPVVVLLHGWPDSVMRFERVLPLLRDCNVVVPALPGFPFAPPLPSTGTNVKAMATMVAEAMDDLGYARYVVSGGDVGGDVAEHLSALYPDRVSALHLTNISALHAVFADRSTMSTVDLDYLDQVAQWQRVEGGYIAEQSSKPDTLAAGLSDSPAGLAAWMVEKLRSWSDNDGDLEPAFTRRDVLDWVSAYWFTNAIGTSFSTYADFVPPVAFVQTPTVISAFAHDTKPAPREFVSRYVHVQEWIEHAAGGHFAAWEQPEAYVADLRAALACVSGAVIVRR